MTSISPYSPPSSTNQQRTGILTVNNLPKGNFTELETTTLLLGLKALGKAITPKDALELIVHAHESETDTLNLFLTNQGVGQKTEIGVRLGKVNVAQPSFLGRVQDLTEHAKGKSIPSLFA